MRKLVMLVLALVIFVCVSGCATGPKTALRPRSLKGDHMIYFEQSDRIPKDVLLESYKAQNDASKAVVANAAVMSPEDIAKLIEEAIKIAPEMVESYGNERMNNALLGRRMLFRGYETPEQLKEIDSIIKSMGDAIENMTPEK